MGMNKYELAAAIEELLKSADGAVKTGLEQALDALLIPSSVGLTDHLVEKHRKGRLLDRACKGLFLESSTRYGKLWRVRNRQRLPGGKEKDTVTTLGRYPDMDLAAARQAWAAYKEHGTLPRVQKQRQSRVQDLLLSDLVDKFCTDYSEVFKSPSAAKNDRSYLTKLVKILGDQPASQLDVSEVRDSLLTIKSTRGEQAAERTRSVLSMLHTVATGADRKLQLQSSKLWLPPDTPNWAASVRFGTSKAQYPLDRNELRSFVTKLDQCEIPKVYQDVLNLQLHTCCRISEVVSLRLEDIHLKDGFARVPEEKSGRGLEIQLTMEAKHIIEANMLGRPGKGWLFPAERNSDRHIKTTIVQRWMRDKRKCLGIERTGKDLEVRGEASPHALRRTCLTWLAEQGYSVDVRDAVANHAPRGGVDSAYTHSAQHRKAARDALDAWAIHLAGLWLDR